MNKFIDFGKKKEVEDKPVSTNYSDISGKPMIYVKASVKSQVNMKGFDNLTDRQKDLALHIPILEYNELQGLYNELKVLPLDGDSDQHWQKNIKV